MHRQETIHDVLNERNVALLKPGWWQLLLDNRVINSWHPYNFSLTFPQWSDSKMSWFMPLHIQSFKKETPWVSNKTQAGIGSCSLVIRSAMISIDSLSSTGESNYFSDACNRLVGSCQYKDPWPVAWIWFIGQLPCVFLYCAALNEY